VRTLGLLLQGLKHSPATWGLHNPLLIALGVVALVAELQLWGAPKTPGFVIPGRKIQKAILSASKYFISYAFASYKVASCV